MTWEPGKWLVICDRCGIRKKSDQVRKEWTGLIVCAEKCWEPRNTQDFVRAVKDDQSVAFGLVVCPKPSVALLSQSA